MTLLSSCEGALLAPDAPVDASSQGFTGMSSLESLPIFTVLDSLTIGGVYTVLPRGGYGGNVSYVASPEREWYAGTITRHPTGIELPVGLPVRILAAGQVRSTSTPAFFTEYCRGSATTDPLCAISSFTHTVHGWAPGPGVTSPYSAGTGLRAGWSRTAPFSSQFSATYPSAEVYRGKIPSADTATTREVHFWRTSCCYLIPYNTTSTWETYSGRWQFGVVPDDGGRPELGEPAVLRVFGPRTDAAMSAAAEFAVEADAADPIVSTVWRYIRTTSNTFDGTPVNAATPKVAPRYPDSRRSLITRLTACDGQTACSYQPSAPGAVVVQATLRSGRVLAARNTGASGIRAELHLACSDAAGHSDANGGTTVVRGDSIRCLVDVLPAGSNVKLTVTDWTFSASDGSFTLSRRASDGFEPDSMVWSGVMVSTGTVSVSGTLGTSGDVESRSVAISVQPRNWMGQLPAAYPTPQYVGQGASHRRLPTRPDSTAHFSRTDHWVNGTIEGQASNVLVVSHGPNRGLAVLRSVPLLVAGIDISMNEDALATQSEFWVAQPQVVRAQLIVNGVTPCTRSVVTSPATKQVLLEHEGMQFEVGSHTERFRAGYASRVGTEMESIVTSAASFGALFEARADAVLAALMQVDRETDAANPLPFNCQFQFLLEGHRP